MGLLSFLGVLSPAHISLFTLTARGKKIGTDQLGNVYHEAAPRKGYKLPRRWVIYKDAPEASNIPPEWHGWIHHQTNIVPSEDSPSYRRPWQKPHLANMTGTNQAYRPPGHILSGGKRDKVSSDYEAWSPPE
ncbi:MAG: NADH:ubiquinone oxidoreductase subunit NDUFA12 [Zetaproteobacteria bacterium]|nr:MAG: NADH:ubiquinone oxidoreductase subunit NDUFA12 [Zetaproteobacteria bacterium]